MVGISNIIKNLFTNLANICILKIKIVSNKSSKNTISNDSKSEISLADMAKLIDLRGI